MNKVLIVDDEVVIAEAIAAVLRDEGYEVTTATNGQEGLARMREYLPCLVLLDLQMPVMDGFEFRRRQLHEREHVRREDSIH